MLADNRIVIVIFLPEVIKILMKISSGRWESCFALYFKKQFSFVTVKNEANSLALVPRILGQIYVHLYYSSSSGVIGW